MAKLFMVEKWSSGGNCGNTVVFIRFHDLWPAGPVNK